MIFDPQAEPLFCQSTDCTSRFVGVDVLAVPLYTSMVIDRDGLIEIRGTINKFLV